MASERPNRLRWHIHSKRTLEQWLKPWARRIVLWISVIYIGLENYPKNPLGMVDVAAGFRSNRRLRAVPDGQVAQSVEQGTENPRVGSSILSLATICPFLVVRFASTN